MNFFFAKQAIYNSDKKVVAYELLHRNSCKNEYDNNVEGNKATYEIINNISNIGIENLIENKKAFINFPKESIINEVFLSLPKEYVVLEILENVQPTNEIIEKIRDLKSRGYTIALDDVSGNMKYKEFLNYIDIYKIDFKLTDKSERKKILEVIKEANSSAKFLAEKIENEIEYKEALDDKYEYYQGFYFSKPIIIDKEMDYLDIISK